jgi:hypothetical protein
MKRMEVKPNIVAELRELLGNDVLLLHCQRGTKKPIGRWKQLTISAMNRPDYLAKLATGNIGVVLGARSGGLCSLDIDDDADYSAYLKHNPSLSSTLRTRGARGGNIWMRMNGSFPTLTPLKLEGRKWGEWRSDGAQTIIHGSHPSGCVYRIVNRTKPLPFNFDALQWPPGLNVPQMPGEDPSVTERTEPTETTEITELAECIEPMERTDADRSGVGVSGEFSPIKSFEDAVECARPTESHRNHERLFELARAVKGIELNRGRKLTEGELLEVFQLWYRVALPHLRTDQNRDDYYFEFLEGYENAMSAIGVNAVNVAWSVAKDATPPPEALQFESRQVRQLVCLCRELSRMRGGRGFFLSCRTVQRLFNLGAPTQAHRWLEGLRRLGILRITDKGSQTTRKATRFQYSGKV